MKNKNIGKGLIILGGALLLGSLIYALDMLTKGEADGLGTVIFTTLTGLASLAGGWFTKEKTAAPAQKDERVQELQDSAFGEQSMKGKGGKQKQTMKNSPGGKQNME